MRIRLLVPLAVLTFVLTGNLQAQDSSVLVSDLLQAIQRGVNDANSRINKDFHNIPPLDSVTLQLQTQTDITGAAASISGLSNLAEGPTKPPQAK